MSRKFDRLRMFRSFEEPTVNLTPLIDVVFVILIMFIVIAPLLELDRIELANGAGTALEKNLAVQETSPISIHVLRDNTIWVDHRLMTMSELSVYLQQAKQRYPSSKPQLLHDRQAHFGVYQAIKNAVESAGFAQMDVILKPA